MASPAATADSDSDSDPSQPNAPVPITVPSPRAHLLYHHNHLLDPRDTPRARAWEPEGSLLPRPGAMDGAAKPEAKLVAGEAGYVLEDVPHVSDYLPDLPTYPNPLQDNPAYSVVKQYFVNPDDTVCQKIVVHKDGPRGNQFCRGFEFQEATVDAIQLGFKNGSLTSSALVRFYLDQIRHLNPLLHAVIEVNPDALTQAAQADSERSSGRCQAGGLHGIPVLLKDNIATRDRLNTTAGSLALLDSVVKRDAGVASRLRRAGAVVLGKANPSEWSNFRPVRSGWSARGGQSLNPYVLSVTPCGSSSGPAIAAAANMAAVTLGTETDGSILCPSSWNSVVGIKPTVGLTSRSGVIPITPRQDSVGPICRTVSDAVQVLDAIVGYDPFDAAATGAASKYIPPGGYKQFLKIDGLRGKRIGIPNGLFEAYGKMQLTVYAEHFNTMRKQGAIVIKDLDIATNLTDLGLNKKIAMNAEFKLSLNAYLSDLLYSPVRSLAEVIAFNNAHPVEERLKDFGQPDLIAAEKTNGIGSVERAAIRRLDELSANGLEKLMKNHQLDAILTPNSDASSFLAVGGFPGIAVPAGYDKQGVPFAVCFGGLKGYEPRLIEIAYAFEQATKVRRVPTFKP